MGVMMYGYKKEAPLYKILTHWGSDPIVRDVRAVPDRCVSFSIINVPLRNKYNGARL